jgi:uroporphyrinogen-III synthase
MSPPPLIVVRPEPGNAATLAAARDLGLDAHGFPLFDVAPLEWDCPDPAGFDGLLAGSANVFRHGGAALAALRGLPAHVVGQITAEAAEAAGFRVGSIGEGGLQVVLARLLGQRLLRLAGEKHIALVPPPGTAIETRTVYAARPLPLPAPLAAMLQGPAVVLLHSGEAARHFAAECERLGTARGDIALACLAPRIADAAGPGWRAVATAAARSDSALLALAGQMCQNASLGALGKTTSDAG